MRVFIPYIVVCVLLICEVGPMCFFFSCDAAHRHLHSFPTRRSSDLPLSKVASTWIEVFGLWAATALPSVSDRKSTRLNSSHRCISYAVFCLKKKNTKIQCMMTRNATPVRQSISNEKRDTSTWRGSTT